MTAAELSRLAADLELDVLGAAAVAPYHDTEQHIRERKARGLFADMRFTMARPEISCHPETLVEGARDRRLGRSLLLRARVGGWPGRRSVVPLHVERRVRVPASRSRRARPAARWGVSRVRRLERPRRPRGCRSCRGGVLREEHDGDHASVRVMGRSRDAGHGRGDRTDAATRARLRIVPALHRRVSNRCARRAWRARRDEVPLVLDASSRSRFPSITGPTWKAASTAATSARTCARGIGGSRNGVASTSTPTRDRHRPFRCGTGSKVTGTRWSRSSIASTFRATTPAGFGEMRS